MATHAARRLADMNENLSDIIAIELLAAAQGIDLRKPLKTSAPLGEVHAMIREVAAFWDQDRLMAPDIAGVSTLIRNGELRRFVPGDLFVP